MGAPYSTSSKHDSGASVIKILLVIVLLAAIAGLSYVVYTQNQKITDLEAELASTKSAAIKLQSAAAPTHAYVSTKGVKIFVFAPDKNQSVKTPIAITGTVPGNWSFEASFPVILKTANGTVLAQTPAQLLGDWTTDKQVPFALKLTYSSTYTGDAMLILKKDNPSGQSQNDDSLSIPVVLE